MRIQCAACGSAGDVDAAAIFCPQCGQRLAARSLAVELRAIHKSFGGVSVLNGLSLEVQPGESVVIVGMSGSGKSVLMEHLIGFQRPDAGTVSVLGIETSADPSEGVLETLREKIGMVFQGSALIDSLSVQENVTLPLRVRGEPHPEADRKADELLRAVGLPADVGPLAPAQLSGGMQKRVGIARALVSSPSILLYDEPTTGLDAATSTTISHLMRSVQESRPDLTSITISHDYLSAGIIADRVLYLDRTTGRLQEVLGRAEIEAIRQRCGQDNFKAVNEIRAKLELFFAQLKFTERPGSTRQDGSVSWVQAFGNVGSGLLNLIGSAILVLTRVGWKIDWSGIPYRLYRIGFQSVLVICSAGAFVGMMLALQIGVALADTGMLDPLPSIVGVTIMEKIGPLVVGLLFAGRVGASISAEIGGKRLSKQFDALRSMAILPERYWLLPVLCASVIAMPILTVALEASALAGAYAVAVYRFHVNSSLFLDQMLERVQLPLFLFGLLRSMVFGAAIALLAYVKGAEDKRSSDDIGHATTIAVSACLLSVIILDFIMVFIVSNL